MARVIVYYAHPGHRHSRANAAMWAAAAEVENITRVDLYAEYPRFHIDIDREQKRLVAHDVIVFQFPMFWYSTPSLIKEWQDLVLEHGFAYGAGRMALRGKAVQLAVTAAGSAEAYSEEGYQRYHMRQFLRPLEQTTKLCDMNFLTPYVFFAALLTDKPSHIEQNAEGYRSLLKALRDDRVPLKDAPPDAVTTAGSLALLTA